MPFPALKLIEICVIDVCVVVLKQLVALHTLNILKIQIQIFALFHDRFSIPTSWIKVRIVCKYTYMHLISVSIDRTDDEARKLGQR